MTWPKFGTEFPDDCAEADLSDAAYRTHAEAIIYLYGQENFALTVKKSTMRRWAGSKHAEQAAAELVAKGFWRDGAAQWTVVHHANVIRQSLAAQQLKRERDKKAQEKFRNKASDISADVSADQAATQTDRQTDRQPKAEGSFKDRGARSAGNSGNRDSQHVNEYDAAFFNR
jgi:hypothetical protein